MLICKPKIPVAEHAFSTPIRCYPSLRMTTANTSSIKDLARLRNHSTLALRYIPSARGAWLGTCGANPVESVSGFYRLPRQRSTHSTFPASNKNRKRFFSGTTRNMTATKIDGTAIAQAIRTRLQQEIKKKQETNPRYKPSLTIVQGTM